MSNSRLLKSFLKGVVIGLLIYYAYPAIYDDVDKMINGDTDKVEESLEGGAVDCQAEFTNDISYLIAYADSLGYKLTFGEAWRPRVTQRYYIKIGRSWTYNSNHLKRRAVDFNLFDGNGKYCGGDLTEECKEAYRDLGEFWEGLDPEHNRYGGFWKRTPDYPHFERRYCGGENLNSGEEE